MKGAQEARRRVVQGLVLIGVAALHRRQTEARELTQRRRRFAAAKAVDLVFADAPCERGASQDRPGVAS
jgi:hypothetical protein